jgi:hypothetical protein
MTPSSADPYAAILHRLTPGDKLAVAHSLWETAWSVTAAGVRLREPLLADDEVTARVRAIFLRAIT